MKILDEKPDALLKRAGRGDEQALLALYQKHQPALYRYALRMTGSRWAAEEIVQEVFLLLIREPQKYEAARGELGAGEHGCGIASASGRGSRKNMKRRAAS